VKDVHSSQYNKNDKKSIHFGKITYLSVTISNIYSKPGETGHLTVEQFIENAGPHRGISHIYNYIYI
jgi:hypothetical protein